MTQAAEMLRRRTLDDETTKHEADRDRLPDGELGRMMAEWPDGIDPSGRGRHRTKRERECEINDLWLYFQGDTSSGGG